MLRAEKQAGFVGFAAIIITFERQNEKIRKKDLRGSILMIISRQFQNELEPSQDDVLLPP